MKGEGDTRVRLINNLLLASSEGAMPLPLIKGKGIKGIGLLKRGFASLCAIMVVGR